MPGTTGQRGHCSRHMAAWSSHPPGTPSARGAGPAAPARSPGLSCSRRTCCSRCRPPPHGSSALKAAPASGHSSPPRARAWGLSHEAETQRPRRLWGWVLAQGPRRPRPALPPGSALQSWVLVPVLIRCGTGLCAKCRLCRLLGHDPRVGRGQTGGRMVGNTTLHGLWAMPIPRGLPGATDFCGSRGVRRPR